MESNELSRLDNLLSRIDEKNGMVFLKKDQELEKKTFQSLSKSPNSFKQLSLRSKSEVVFLDLRLVLQLSPFLDKLVAQLGSCCFSPHDQVDICLDQFPPPLLYLIKNLLEKGECIVKSRPEEKQLEDLIMAMGMDASLQLYRRVHVEERSSVLDAEKEQFELDKIIPVDINTDPPVSDVKGAKRKFMGEKSKLGLKLRRCNYCEQSFNASQIHICVNTNNNNVIEDEVEMGGGVIDTPEDRLSIGGIENAFENVKIKRCKTLQEESCFKKGEGLEKSCPQCNKVYKMMGAGKGSYLKHIQSCYKTDLPESVKIQEFEEKSCPYCRKTYKMWGAGRMSFETHKQVCSKSKYNEEFVIDQSGDQLELMDPDILSKQPSIEKEKIECPSCGKKYFLKGRGITYDVHVGKCLGEVKPVKDSEVNNSLDYANPKNEQASEKERKECPSCGKFYVAKGRGAIYDVHLSKCQGEKLDSEVFDISLFVDEENETAPSKTNECNAKCNKCGKIYKTGKRGNIVYHFEKHILNCQAEAPAFNYERNKKDSKLAGSYDNVVQCEICQRIFVGSEAFVAHKVDCSGVKEKLPCPHGCGKEFAYKGRLKNHLMNCPLMEDDKEKAMCQICKEGEFVEKDLYMHLYRNHEDLRKKVHKSVSDNFSNYYTLEREKKNCICPICGKNMKASRSPVGVHWAVEHKKMRQIYLSYLKGSTNSQTNDMKKESERGKMENLENIEDYEEVAMGDHEFSINHELEEKEYNKKAFENGNRVKNKGNLSKEDNTFEDNDQKDQDKGKEYYPRFCIGNIRTGEEDNSVAGPSTQQESKNLQDKLYKEDASVSNDPRSHQERMYAQIISDFGLETRKNIPKNDSRAIRNQLFGESDSEDNSD